MGYHTDLLELESRRIFNKRIVFALLLVFIVIIYHVQAGIDSVKTQEESIKQFKISYQKYFENIRNYEVYSVYGIQVLFVKCGLDFLYRNSVVPEDLISKFDSSSSLRILNDFKGKSLSPAKISVDMGFSGISMYLINLLALLYGYFTFDNKEYYKSLSTLLSPGKIYLSVILARSCIILLPLIYLSTAILVVISLNGILLSSSHYIAITGYMIVDSLMVIFFFILGVVTGIGRKGILSKVLALLLWFIFLFAVPGIINTMAEKLLPGTIANYRAELKKFKIISDFEKSAAKKTGGFNKNRIEVARKITESYWNNERKEVEAVEQELRDRVASFIDRYKSLAVFTPVTFYQLTGSEASGRGYANYLKFYDRTIELKTRFTRFYIDRCYYNDPKKLVSFIKDGENLFYAEPLLPDNFWQGVIINLVNIIILAMAGFYRFRNYLYTLESRQTAGKDNRPIIVGKSELKAICMGRGKGLNEKLYNRLSGWPRTSETIRLEIGDVDFTGSRERAPFIYICHPGQIPGDIDVAAFVSFILRLSGVSKKEKQAICASLKERVESPGIKGRTFAELNNREKSKVFSALLPYFKGRIYLVDNVGIDMPVGFLIELNDIMLGWAGQGAAVIYLTTERAEKELNVENIKESKNDCDYHEEKMWSEMVSRLKELDIVD